MAYSTQADIPLSNEMLVQATDDAGTGSLNQGVLDATIQRADRLIDAYLRGRYVVPFNPAPPEVVELSAQLTRYYLEERRLSTPTEGARQAYKDAMTVLKDLQAGRATLSTAGQTSEIDQKPGRIVSNKTAESRMFPKSLLDRF